MVKNKILFFLLILISINTSIYFLGADSWLYLRQAENLKQYGTFGDKTSFDTGKSIDTLRTFPEGSITQFNYFTYVFYLLNLVLPIHVLPLSFSYTILLTQLIAFLTGSIVWVLTKDKTSSVIAAVMFLVSPTTQVFTFFDTQLLRLFLLLAGFLVFTVLFTFKTGEKKEAWYKMFLFVAVVAFFKTQIMQLVQSVLALSNYSFVSELTSPDLWQVIYAYPTIFLLVLYIACFVMTFKFKEKFVDDKINWFVLYFIFSTSAVFLFLGFGMVRFFYFFTPFAAIFVCAVASKIFVARNDNSLAMVFKENFFIMMLITLFVLYGLSFSLMRNNSNFEYFTSDDAREAQNFLKYKDGFLMTWWSYAYYWQYSTRMPTLVDGGTFVSEKTKWMADVFTSGEPTAAILVRELQTKTNKKAYLLFDEKMLSQKEGIKRISQISSSFPSPLSFIDDVAENKPMNYFEKVFESSNSKIKIYALKENSPQ